MTTATTTTASTAPSGRDLLRGKPQSGGGDFKTEVPSADVHDARVVAIVDLGTHQEAFGGTGPLEWKRSLYLVFELDEEMTGMKGANHVVGQKYTLSFHEKANLRKLAENLLNEGAAYGPEDAIDYSKLLGQPCAVQISHETKPASGDKPERTYAKIKAITSIAKKKRAAVFAPRREKKEWYVGDALSALPDYLPRIYGEKAEDVIRRCRELTARPEADDEDGDEGAVPGGQDDPPF